MKRSRPSHSPAHQRSSGTQQRGALRGFFLAMLTALYVARPLLPSEGVAWHGDGQAFNMLWMLLALGVLFEAGRTGDIGIRWTAADMAVGALVGITAMSASSAALFGNPRPSLNMLWEWIALGLAYFFVRLLVRTEREARAIAAAMIAVAVVLSVYGYYQYRVEMPDTRAQYAKNPETMLQDAGHWQPKGSPERKLF